MSGGGGGTTTQKADPWSGVQPFLTQMYQGASNAYNTPPSYYPGSTVAAPDQYTMDTMDQITKRANGSPEEALFKANAGALANGSDQLSQYLGGVSQGGGQINQDLRNTAYGNTQQGQVLNQLAQGGGASGDAFKSILGGNDSSSQYLKSVMNGDYLNGNPYLAQMVGNVNSDTTRDFNNSVLPGIASQLSAAGRYGSGAQQGALNDASLNLSKTLSNNATNIYGTNYANERGLQNGAAGTLGQYLLSAANGLGGQQAGAAGQMNSTALSALGQQANNQNNAAGLLNSRQNAGLSMLPTAANMDWNNLSQRANVGQYLDTYAQQQKADDVARYNFGQQSPWSQLQNYNGILNGAMALNGSTTQAPGAGAARSLLSGGMSGAMAGAAMGSIIPGLGTGLGAAIGGIGGGLMGVL